MLLENLTLVVKQVLLNWNPYYLKSCISGYEIKFENSMDDKIVSKQFKKRDIFANCITFIKSINENWNGIFLSEKYVEPAPKRNI